MLGHNSVVSPCGLLLPHRIALLFEPGFREVEASKSKKPREHDAPLPGSWRCKDYSSVKSFWMDGSTGMPGPIVELKVTLRR